MEFGLCIEKWEDLYTKFRKTVELNDLSYQTAIIYFDTTEDTYVDFLLQLEEFDWFDYREMNKIQFEISIMIDELVHEDIFTSNTIMLNSKHIDDLISIPETSSGYHIVDIMLKNGDILKNRVVFNFHELILNEFDPPISANDIIKILTSR